jgi:F-type H+-transporting ATPase subunit epsilon
VENRAGLTVVTGALTLPRIMAFNCVVVTPDEQVVDQQVSQVVFPAYDGQIGIMTHRAPLLAKLGVGELKLMATSGGERSFFVDGGIAQMKGNKLTVLTTQAVPVEELSAEAARAELAEASARRITDPASAEQRDHALRRARAMEALARK